MRGWTGRSLVLGTGAALLATLGLMARSAQSQTPHTIQMIPTKVELEKTLDAKKARTGDPVTAKLEQEIKINSGQDVPKGSLLEGQVTQVQASEHKSDSSIVITFSKLHLKSGDEIPVKATLISISSPNYLPQSSGVGQPMPMAQSPSTGMGGGSPSTSSPLGSEQNGVPGVKMTSDIHQSSSATFTSKGKNVNLPGGTEMEVGVAYIPPGVKLE